MENVSRYNSSQRPLSPNTVRQCPFMAMAKACGSHRGRQRRSRATHEVYVRAPLAIAFCARLSASRKRMASCCCSGSGLAPGI